MRIQFEIWNNTKIPNLNCILFNSKVNFLAGKSEGGANEVF